MKIYDDRYNNDKKLCEIELGGYFVFESPIRHFVGRRIESDLSIDVFDDELPVMVMETGEVVGIDRDRLVEPIKAELHIVD